MLLLVLGDALLGLCGAYAPGGMFADATHTFLHKRPFWVITPLVMLGFGLQFITLGLMAELQARTYHESQNKPVYVIRESAASRRQSP